MLHSLLTRLFLLIVGFAFSLGASAAESSTNASAEAAKPREFLIVMRLTPKYHQAEAWTAEANQTVGAHFTRLKEAAARGEVILAGRTLEPHDKTIGLVVLTAADEVAAEAFMRADPCVVAGIMSATLHPYAVAIRGK